MRRLPLAILFLLAFFGLAVAQPAPPGLSMGVADKSYLNNRGKGRSAQLLRTGGQTVVSSGGNNHFSGGVTIQGSSATTCWSHRVALDATYPADQLRLWFAAYTAGNSTLGEVPGSAFWLRISLQRMGVGGPSDQSRNKVPLLWPNGSRWIRLQGTDVAGTMARAFPLWQNERYFAWLDIVDGVGSAPAAPTLGTPASGGSLTAGTLTVVATYVYPGVPGEPNETVGSSNATVSVTANQKVDVTALTDPADGAIGYNIYAIVGSGVPIKINDKPLKFAGTNPTISAIPSSPKIYAPIGHPSCGLGVLSKGEYVGSGTTFSALRSDGGVLGASGSFQYMPLCVTGVVRDSLAPSLAAGTDSISQGTGDALNAYANGGYIVMAARTAGMPYVQVGRGGETSANFSDPALSGSRVFMTGFATTFVDDGGTNDLTSASISVLQCYRIAIGRAAVDAGLNYVGTTLLPRTTATNSYIDVAGQSRSGEGTWEQNTRQPFNTWVRSTSAAGAAVSGENIGTGDASKRAFVCSRAFKIGSEIVLSGATRLYYGTDYWYTNQGGDYASGITTSAAATPGNAVAVTMSYTGVPGMVAAIGSGSKAWDVCAPVEVNSSNVLTPNGGYWKAGGSQIASGTWTTVDTSSGSARNFLILTDSSANYTTSGVVVGDWIKTSTGACYPITALTATTLTTLGNAATVTNGTTYTIWHGTYVMDGTHPSTLGHQTIAATWSSVFTVVAMNQPRDLVTLSTLRRDRYNDLLTTALDLGTLNALVEMDEKRKAMR